MFVVRVILLLFILLAFLLFGGCVTSTHKAEEVAKAKANIVKSRYRPYGRMPDLPNLNTNSELSDFILFAVYNSPSVQSAFYEWISSVEIITADRSLPDPVLTFQLDLTKTIEALMPGLMFDIPGRGKLQTRAIISSENSEIYYQNFVSEVLKTIHNLKTVYYQIYLLKQKINLIEEKIEILKGTEKNVRFNIESGAAIPLDLISIQSEKEKTFSELKILRNSMESAKIRFKSALGLKPEEILPPIPYYFQFTTNSADLEKILEIALSQNPSLKALESEIRRATAEIEFAERAKKPDFKAGIETSLYPSPVMYRPQFGMSLPIWKEKIRSQISSAEARKKSVASRFEARRIELATEFAVKIYEYKELEILLNLITQKLLPQIQMQTAFARNEFSSNKGDLYRVYEFLKAENELKLQEVELQAKREIVLSELTLLIGGVLPEEIEFLSGLEKPLEVKSIK